MGLNGLLRHSSIPSEFCISSVIAKLRGQQNRGDVLRFFILAYLLDEFEPGHKRHLVVGHDDVGMLAARQLVGLGSVVSRDDFVSVVAKFYRNDMNNVNLIIRDQHLLACHFHPLQNWVSGIPSP